MGGSFGKSKSKSQNQSDFAQDVWSEQAPALQQLYQSAQNLFGGTQAGMQSQVPGATEYMQGIQQAAMPAWQQQIQGGAYADLGLGDRLMSSLEQSQAQPSAMQDINAMIMGGPGNTYADAMRDQYVQDATRAQENMLRNLDARATASGMSGGARHGVATAQVMRDINRNLQSQMARTGYETFDKDLERKLAIAHQADQSNLARQQMMSNMLGQQQQAMSGGLGAGGAMQNLGMGTFSPYMAPWMALGNYAQAIGGPQVLSSGSGSGSGSAKGLSMAGGL